MNRIFTLVAWILAAAFAARGEGDFLSVKDGRFVDAQGRQVLLHGMSVISKSPAEHYQSWHGPEDFAALRDWGMNCIRLGILWAGIEAEPGQYDEDYLKKVDQRIAWARENGIHVYLDMHQDLFSVLYSDGAPAWATLSDGKPHLSAGGVWSDAYFTSPAVQAALDNFWANTPGPGGVGIQDRFAQAWRHVAARYADEPTVIGYDLFNEPNLGSQNTHAQRLAIGKLAELLSAKTGESVNVEDLGMKWLDPRGRSEIMALLRDMDIFTAVTEAPAEIFRDFERNSVTPLFQRASNAIREVDRRHLLFLETSMSSNMGILTAIEPVLGPDGQRDPLQVYAPHAYDIVVDTPDLANASNERMAFILGRHGESAERLGMPMMLGEWGAFGGAGPEILPSAKFILRQFEKLRCSDTFWLYSRGVEEAAYFEVLCRPIPVAVAGTLVAYRDHPDTKTFTCTWKEDPSVTAPTRIYLPARSYAGPGAVRLEPTVQGFEVEPAAPGSANVVLVIQPSGEAVQRNLAAIRH